MTLSRSPDHGDTAARERPILFSGPMVRAILDGRKTQTRRVMKAIRGERGNLNPAYLDQHCDPARAGRDTQSNREAVAKMWCPYGQPGERLWVRETYRVEYYRQNCRAARVAYASTAAEAFVSVPVTAKIVQPHTDGEWRPSIHMPRWASRITLEITGVRVERVQDISEADATAEGAEPILVPPDGGSTPYIEGYRALWDSLNAERGYGWDVNPWVWVMEFQHLAEAS